MKRSIINLLLIFAVVIIGTLLNISTKENLYVYLTYLMIVFNTFVTLCIVDEIKKFKEQTKSKDSE